MSAGIPVLTPTRLVAVGLLWLAGPSSAHAMLVLDKIVLHSKDPDKTLKTSVAAIEARMRLHHGDAIDFGILGVAEDQLVATDLFVSVKVELDLPRERAAELMYLSAEIVPVDVHVTIEEKFSWFIVPSASFGGGDKAAGLIYADQNLLGRGYRLVGASQFGESKTYAFLGFHNPIMTFAPLTYSVAGVYRIETFRFFENHRQVLEVPTTVYGGEAQVGYVFSSQVRALVGGLYHRNDLGTEKRPIDWAPQQDPSYNRDSGNIVVLQLVVIYDATTAPEGLRRGAKIRLKNEISDALWQSDFDYVKLDFQAEVYGYFYSTYPSVVFRSVLNYPTSARGVPLTEVLRAGGADLRGYLVNEFHGDTLVTVQIEDQVPIVTRINLPFTDAELNIAGAVFADTGALIERHLGGRIGTTVAPVEATRPKFEDFHSSLGGGLRLLVPGVAIPALKVDLAYGLDVGDVAVTISVAGGGL